MITFNKCINSESIKVCRVELGAPGGLKTKGPYSHETIVILRKKHAPLALFLRRFPWNIYLRGSKFSWQLELLGS